MGQIAVKNWIRLNIMCISNCNSFKNLQLLRRLPCSSIPSKVEGVGFCFGCSFFRILNPIVPTVFFYEGNGIFFRGKINLKFQGQYMSMIGLISSSLLDLHIRKRISRRSPPHEVVFPAFTSFKLNFPPSHTCCSWLHGIFSGTKNPHVSLLQNRKDGIWFVITNELFMLLVRS